MKGKDVEVGKVYVVKVSGLLAPVRVKGVSPYGGWDCVNERTGRAIRVRGAARFRAEVRNFPA